VEILSIAITKCLNVDENDLDPSDLE